MTRDISAEGAPTRVADPLGISQLIEQTIEQPAADHREMVALPFEEELTVQSRSNTIDLDNPDILDVESLPEERTAAAQLNPFVDLPFPSAAGPTFAVPVADSEEDGAPQSVVEELELQPLTEEALSLVVADWSTPDGEVAEEPPPTGWEGMTQLSQLSATWLSPNRVASTLTLLGVLLLLASYLMGALVDAQVVEVLSIVAMVVILVAAPISLVRRPIFAAFVCIVFVLLLTWGLALRYAGGGA